MQEAMTDNAALDQHPPQQHLRHSVSRWLLLVSLALCLFIAGCYAFRPDACAAITIFPSWSWTVLGLLLTGAGWKAGRRKVLVVLLCWIVYTGIFAEECHSLAHIHFGSDSTWQAARQQRRAVRVISLNCAGGTIEAARETMAFHPDILLMQESPVHTAVEELGRQLFGKDAGVLWGPDGSMIVHGHLTAAPIPRTSDRFFVQAHVRLTNGREVEIISLRLLPPVFRDDLWSPVCWREQAENRRARRAQLDIVARRVMALPAASSVIIGGDFNAPAGDAVFHQLRPRLHDAFSDGGQGWGDTIINDFPVLRIDQIWTSARLSASSVIARTTQNSDHRMVICDLIFAE